VYNEKLNEIGSRTDIGRACYSGLQSDKQRRGECQHVHSAKFEDGEFSGWNADDSKFPNGFVKFNSSDMVNLVNGGAADYVAKGMSEGFQQDMAKGDLTYRSWVMDFGTEANAKEMYNSQIQQLASVKEAAGSYPETVAFWNKSYMGMMAMQFSVNIWW
jgi:hypothetical protein